MKSPIPWPEIEACYKGGETATVLSKRYPVTRQGIERRALKYGWVRAKPEEAVSSFLQVAQATDIINSEARLATPQKVAAILQTISNGATERLASIANGLSPATLTEWKGKDPKLSAAIDAARANRAIHRAGKIEEASDRGDWKASQYLLERDPMSKDDYADIRGSGGLNIQINIHRDYSEDIDVKTDRVISDQ